MFEIRSILNDLGISLNIFFSASKLEVMLFTRKHERPPILVRIGSYLLPQTTCFTYLGVFFDAGLRWSCRAAKMPPKSKLIEIGGRCLTVLTVTSGSVHQMGVG
jgi:hypothetical protein